MHSQLTAICSASGRATLSDARALLTREIQKIQKIRQGPCDAVVDTSIDEDGLYESSIARMSNSLSRRVDFGELDLPAHLSLLERRAFGLRQICFSIVLRWLLIALLHRLLLLVRAPESNFYLWMVNVMAQYEPCCSLGVAAPREEQRSSSHTSRVPVPNDTVK